MDGKNRQRLSNINIYDSKIRVLFTEILTILCRLSYCVMETDFTVLWLLLDSSCAMFISDFLYCSDTFAVIASLHSLCLGDCQGEHTIVITPDFYHGSSTINQISLGNEHSLLLSKSLVGLGSGGNLDIVLWGARANCQHGRVCFANQWDGEI